MAYPMGEANLEPLRVDFDRRVKLEFHGSDIATVGGLLQILRLHRNMDSGYDMVTKCIWNTQGGPRPLIYLGTNSTEREKEALQRSLFRGEHDLLRNFILGDDRPRTDFILELQQPPIRHHVDRMFKKCVEAKVLEAKNLGQWLKKISRTAEGLSYIPHSIQLDNETQYFLICLEMLKKYFNRKFEILIKRHVELENIPIHGSFLYFTSGLKYCILINYHFDFGSMHYDAVEIFAEPNSVLDINNIAQLDEMVSQNLAKAFLVSGHKIIVHRDVLTHVDRRVDKGVFGPSIDTLLLSEILAQEISRKDFSSILEIGCGNGHITSSVFQNSNTVKQSILVDKQSSAIMCSNRNITANNMAIGKKNIEQYYVIGNFTCEWFNKRFDLVVCNPPYVPLPSFVDKLTKHKRDYFHAIAGTDLLLQVIKNSADMLTAHGRMLLIVSSVSGGNIFDVLPSGVRCRNALPDKELEVPFDVEAVLTEPEWVRELESAGGLFRTGKIYTHRICPIWIEIE